MEVPVCANNREEIKLIETFLWVPGKGAPDIDLHLERMCKSAGTLKFKFEIKKLGTKYSKFGRKTALGVD